MHYSRLALLAFAGLTSARNVFHFGDSYSATSFDFQGALPTTENPIGNPAFPGQTILDGPANWVGHFISDYPTSGGSPTFVYNYAVSGARVNNALEPGNDPSHLDLGQQYSQFASQADSLLNTTEDVVSIYFGTNDINAYLADIPAYTLIIGNMMSIVQQMYAAQGVRRFVFFSMDPLYRTPSYVNGDLPQIATVNAAIGTLEWNAQLWGQMAAWSREKGDVRTVVYDTMPAFNVPLDDPQAYGAPDSQCHNPDATSCLWFDTLHPGTAIMKEIAKGFAEALKQMDFWS